MKQKLIDSTIEAWQPYYKNKLNKEDASEILTNWFEFIHVVSEWVEQSTLHKIQSDNMNLGRRDVDDSI